MDLALAGKRAVVTGGSRGIGLKIARQLAEEGVDVAIAARGSAALELAAEQIAVATGRRIVPLVADLRDDVAVDRMVATAVDELGGLDILVNNAATPGGHKVAAIENAEIPGLLADIDTKIGGYLRAARAAAPHLTAAGWGRIINIGGLAARLTGNYNAAIRNAGISALTKNLADELGPRGVGVLAIHPGAMHTPGLAPAVAAAFSAASSNGTLFTSDAIAWLVTVLCSPHSVALNGNTLAAGGGIKGVIDY